MRRPPTSNPYTPRHLHEAIPSQAAQEKLQEMKFNQDCFVENRRRYQ